MDLIQKILTSSNLAYCAVCGKCLSVCPSYREFANELHSPRGRLLLVKAFVEGQIDGSERLISSISHCLLCGACNTVCPAGIKPAEAIMWVRGHQRFRREMSRLERFLLGRVVRDQGNLRLLTTPVRLYQRLGLRQVLQRFGLLRLLPQSIDNLESLLPEYQGKPFFLRVPDIVPAGNKQKGKITFFAGCAMNLLFPRASQATVEIAAELGWDVKIPKEVFCCGAPHLHEGDLDTARQLALHNIEVLMQSDISFILTDCASCTAMLKTYPELFDESSADYGRATEFANKVRDVTEFFQAEITDLTVFRPYDGLRIAYDPPCELQHVLEVTEAPQELLSRLPGVQLIKIPESDWCCGSAGAYSIKHPEVAQCILRRKIENIIQSSPDYLVLSNPGCMLYIGKGLRDRKAKTRLMHLSEFLKVGLRKLI